MESLILSLHGHFASLFFRCFPIVILCLLTFCVGFLSPCSFLASFFCVMSNSHSESLYGIFCLYLWSIWLIYILFCGYYDLFGPPESIDWLIW